MLLLLTSIDDSLAQWIATYGAWAIGIVAAIIFAETGLVFLPFLPGDSLLFVAGTLFASAGANIHGAALALGVAAVLGDATNFAVGRFFAPRILRAFKGRWLQQSHLDATHEYFARYGPSTIVIARFVPIVRTMAPFLAGAGQMHYARFAIFNVVGATAWVGGLFYAGAWLGSQPFVRAHISAITLGIAAVSVVPVACVWLRERKAARSRSRRGAHPANP